MKKLKTINNYFCDQQFKISHNQQYLLKKHFCCGWQFSHLTIQKRPCGCKHLSFGGYNSEVIYTTLMLFNQLFVLFLSLLAIYNFCTLSTNLHALQFVHFITTAPNVIFSVILLCCTLSTQQFKSRLPTSGYS